MVRLIHGIETGGERITVAAFGRDHLALAMGATLQVVELAGANATRVHTIALGKEPKTLRMSPSGSHVLSVDSERVRVWFRSGSTPMFERPIDLAKTSVGALFARLGEHESLLFEPDQAQLEAYDLASGDQIFRGATETFLAASATSIERGTEKCEEPARGLGPSSTPGQGRDHRVLSYGTRTSERVSSVAHLHRVKRAMEVQRQAADLP